MVKQPRYVKTSVITMTLALAVVTTLQQAQAVELIIEQYEDLSITLKTLNGTELKGYANVNALAGPNCLQDIVQQMESWN
jgi:hypothetical protein